MMLTISAKLRSCLSTTFIFLGLFVVVLGGLIVRAGAWLDDREVIDSEDDLSQEELLQIYKEAQEARSKDETKS